MIKKFFFDKLIFIVCNYDLLRDPTVFKIPFHNLEKISPGFRNNQNNRSRS